MHTETMMVTPEMAKKFIQKNVQNRPVSKQYVRALVSDIVSGKFYTTHQGIAFDEDGYLIDGQHRLLAIIQAGIPVTLMVTTGLPRGTVMGIDTTRKRSYANIAKLLGRPGETNKFAAVARIVEFGPNYFEISTPGEQTEMVEKYKEALDFIVGYGGGIHGLRVQTLAALVRAYYHESHDRLIEFIDVYRAGVSYDPDDSAAAKLKLYMLSQGKKIWATAEGRMEIYQISETAIKAFCKRRPVKRLAKSETEVYPLALDRLGNVRPALA